MTVALVSSGPGEDPRDCWRTPAETFLAISSRYGPFDLDCAADPSNAKCPRWLGAFGVFGDALACDWGDYGSSGFCNPPFSKLDLWLPKCWSVMGPGRRMHNLVLLMPATKTEQQIWQVMVEGYRDGRTQLGDVSFTSHFWPTRIEYEPPPGVKASGPRFGTAILRWRRGT